MDNVPVADVFDNENPWRLDRTNNRSGEVEKESGSLYLISKSPGENTPPEG